MLLTLLAAQGDGHGSGLEVQEPDQGRVPGWRQNSDGLGHTDEREDWRNSPSPSLQPPLPLGPFVTDTDHSPSTALPLALNFIASGE
jgi:hypothetical protein